MRILVILLIPLMVCCKINVPKDNDILLKYHYPFDSLIRPKVFIYYRTDSISIKRYTYNQIIKKNNKSILISSSMAQGDWMMRDSTIFSIINGISTLSESYTILRDKETNIIKAVKGEILKNINDPYIREIIIKYSNPFNKVDFQTEIVSKCDTPSLFKFNDHKINCVKCNDNLSISFKSNDISLSRISKYISGTSIYGLGLGLIYYTKVFEDNGKEDNWILEKIIDYNDFGRK